MNGNNMRVDQPVVSKVHKRLIWGAIFLMATSSIGPAFLTQTTVFTEEHLANFAFAILASVIIDVGAQLNIWRILIVSGKRGQDVANMVLPGLGTAIAIFIVIGGLAFNIGNVAGGGLGMNVLFGVSTTTGAVISGVLAIIVFLFKNSNKIMDVIALTLGVVMLLMVGYVMLTTNPPVAEAAMKSIFPDDMNALIFPTITLIGGTVGGYITFAGGHRLLDAGVKGKENLSVATKASSYGILTTGVMRLLLFLAVLGVVSAGYKLDQSNPAASVFQIALGDVGYKIFGIVLASAALTSIIGSAYTSVSFMSSFHKNIQKYNNHITIGFILFSTVFFAFVGEPVKILVIVGSLNGLVLPLTLGAILLASRNKKIIGDYRHPTWMIVFGVLAVAITLVAGWLSLQGIADLWNG